ncbi:EamA family transporter, partial [Pseudomonas aeruginosa]|nr:EamA family transporter [Pseudomonas aeruginosa]
MRATTCTPRAMPGATRLLAVQLGMVLAWSSGFVGYRYAMEQAPVFLTSFWRFAVCLALLLPFAWAGLRRLSARQWRRQALIGALAYAGYIAPIAKAIELGVSPGVAALMADLLPLLVALLALVLPGLPRAAAEGWLALGYPAEPTHHALAGSDVSMLRDILLQHAWSLFHHSELALLEECLNALPYERL